MENHNLRTIVSFGIGVLLGMLIMVLITGKDFRYIDDLVVTDTAYNKIKLDSIKVVIGKHDTTIYKLNIKMKDDVEQTLQLNDSATIELFRKLVTSQ